MGLLEECVEMYLYVTKAIVLKRSVENISCDEWMLSGPSSPSVNRRFPASE